MPQADERRMRKSIPFGRERCRFHDPSTFGLTPAFQRSNDIEAKLESISTIAAWMQPRIGGMIAPYCLITFSTADAFIMSQAGASTQAPFAFSSRNSALAFSFEPERESSSRFLAPRSTSHREILRPRPPRPPAIT